MATAGSAALGFPAAGLSPNNRTDANGWIRVVGDRRPRTDGQGNAPRVRAAEYVRMSTDHQKYSTENQADAIRQYAESRGFEIVRTYADEGKSGLRVDGRDALKRLIDDVQSGNADFATILVYDVSRWGRFQDADESAYYEYSIPLS